MHDITCSDSIKHLWTSVEEHFGVASDIRISVIESLLRGGEPGGWSIGLWLAPRDRRRARTERIIGTGETREEAISSAVASMPGWAHVLRESMAKTRPT